MNRRFTLFMVVVAVALGAMAFLVRDTKPRNFAEGTPTPTPVPLLTVPITDVQQVAVVAPTGHYTLTRVAGGWEVDGRKTNDGVEAILRRITSPLVIQELPESSKPDDYGFSTPQMTVTIKTAAGAISMLQFGDITPVDPNVYVRLDGKGKIVVINNGDFNTLKDWLTTPPLAPTPTPDASKAITGTKGTTGTLNISPTNGLTAPPAPPTPELPTAESTPQATEAAPPPGPTEAAPTAASTEAGPTSAPTEIGPPPMPTTAEPKPKPAPTQATAIPAPSYAPPAPAAAPKP